jgi:LruC domain-containing protein
MKKVLLSDNRVRFQASLFGILAIALAGLSLAGCNFNLGDPSYKSFSEITIPTNFTFATSRTVRFDLGILQNDDSGTLIPFANGVVNVLYQDETGDHILGAGTTDASGLTVFDTIVPNAVSSVVIRPERNILVECDQSLPASITKVSLTLSPGSVAPKSPIESSVSENISKVALPKIPFETVSGYLMLSAYGTDLGVPTSMGTARSFKQSFIDDVGATYPEYKKVPDTNPSYLTVGDLSNTNLTKNAEVSVSFVSEGAGYLNTLGYFVYKTSEKPMTPPGKDQIVIIFPNASALYSGGGLKSGDTMNLRNPVKTIDGKDNPFYQTTVFNEGYSIGWVIIPSGFKKTTISDALVGRYYSLWPLNPERVNTQFARAHTALLLYNSAPYSDTTGSTVSTADDAIFLLGFEDLNRETGDNDFNDCLFAVQSTPYTAVETAGMPVAKKLSTNDRDGDGVIDIYDEYPDDILRSSSVSYPSTTTFGTAMFEDLWPSIGDFDFNDLVADYRFKTVRNAKGEAVELIASFKLRAVGADIASGLAFTLPLASGSVSGVSYTKNNVAWALQDGLNLFKRETNDVEKNGASSIAVPVFSSGHAMFGLSSGTIINTNPAMPYFAPVTITVTVSFQTGLEASRISGAPLDIFLVSSPSNANARKEVHTIGNLPTLLASESKLFGTEHDDSSISPTGLHYKSKKTTKSSAGAPWGLILPMSAKYPIEKSELPSSYLHFGEWVTSSGANYADWYNSGKSGYADASVLYGKE